MSGKLTKCHFFYIYMTPFGFLFLLSVTLHQTACQRGRESKRCLVGLDDKPNSG